MLRKVLFTAILIVVFVLTLVGSVYFYNTNFIESENPVSVAPTGTKFVGIRDEQIAYSEINNNSSTTIIFVGGLSAWNGTWERVVQELNNNSKNYNYIAIDLPPFGYSQPDSQRGYFRDTQAQRLASFIDVKKLSSVILVGHSYGAGPVAEYALNNQDRVEKLILIDAVLNIDEEKKDSAFGPEQIDLVRSTAIGLLIHNDSFALSRLKSFVYVTDHVDQMLLDVYTDYFKTSNVTNRFSAWFKDYMNDPLAYKSNNAMSYTELKIPVRLIWGDKDTLTPIEGADILLETIPDSRLITLTNVGHIPMIEDYAQFDTALLDALQE